MVTEYRHNSHADVVIGKYLEGFRQNGQPPGPRSKIVSMYTAQVPKNDMSREMSKKHNVPIYPTIWETLTLGGDQLAVDGVLLIGEHGQYPWNEKGQHLYPRYELFLEITDVFRASRKSVPVFSDKHLSYSWLKARRMVDIAKELKFPFMAGSSIPVRLSSRRRRPGVGRESEARGIYFYGDPDAYGFHLLEGLQCMVERREGGETGVKAIQYIRCRARSSARPGPLRLAGIATSAMDAANPRFSGSDHLLNHALKAAGEHGAETRLIRLNDLKFRACEGYYSKAARACTWPCSITQMDTNDQMDQVYEAWCTGPTRSSSRRRSGGARRHRSISRWPSG